MEPPGLCRICCLIRYVRPDPCVLNGETLEMTKRSTAAGAVALAGALLVAAFTVPASAQCGSASWYALYSQTASGEQMDPSELTAAHRTLPFGTKLKVTNQKNGKTVVVRINDRGPFIKGRVIDLSKAAANRLGFVSSGVTSICMARA
jgi:rare lipoprotein A